ncbi:MAG: hypothetical protein IJZ73_04155 [Clostridia bacterium]|nr:hypothetical protein [Clostridia bacterium]
MNLLYTKTLLTSYANLENVMAQIDELAVKKALASANDYSPCATQCEKIIELNFQKDVIHVLKLTMDGILKKTAKKDLDLLDYKYFKRRPRAYYKDFDSSSRTYFRNQVRVAKEFGDKLDRIGISDEWFEENCLSTEFFSELYKRVKEHEIASHKNKSKEEKEIRKSLAIFNAKAQERRQNGIVCGQGKLGGGSGKNQLASASGQDKREKILAGFNGR